MYLFMQIYSEICSCQSSYKCHTLIQAPLANLSSDPGEGTLLINSSAPARKTDCRVPLSYCGTSECFLLWRSWLPFLTFTLSSSLTFTLSHFNSFTLSHSHTFTLSSSNTEVIQRNWLPFIILSLSHFLTSKLSHFHTFFKFSSPHTFTLSDTQVSQRSWLPSDSSHLDSSALFQVLIILSHNRPIWVIIGQSSK